MKFTLTCILMMKMMMMTASPNAENEMAIRKVLPPIVINIVDYFVRVSELLKSPHLDKLIREIQGDKQGLLQKISKCVVVEFFQYLVHNKDTNLGQLALGMGVTETMDQIIDKNPYVLLAMVAGAIRKLKGVHWDQVLPELKTIFLEAIPRTCATEQDLVENVNEMHEVFKLLKKLGVPWEKSP